MSDIFLRLFVMDKNALSVFKQMEGYRRETGSGNKVKLRVWLEPIDLQFY